ncbi:5265_t:CDS:2 [Funneliformis caledonium]|uniref:5265_t:CDS:1 n=1 Tax=Funneliformis caledonium TaxID=1117310 RepID=A0A9N9IIG1_9GLOM|nr:5265_t:CDS:2 [Funneliformis caledonium]
MSKLPEINPCEESKFQRESTIVLNVGGIKFETYPSTLTAYPDTFLGRMFLDRNKTLLHPQNGNEYFFDRNGYAFRYILEFYRTGKLLLTEKYFDKLSFVTREELEEEINYFQIPTPSETNLTSKSIHIDKIVGERVNEFVKTFEEVIYEMIKNYRTCFKINFYNSLKHPTKWLENHAEKRDFVNSGYDIMKNFNNEIYSYFKEKFNDFSWEIKEFTEYLIVEIKVDYNYPNKNIIKYTCLAESSLI